MMNHDKGASIIFNQNYFIGFFRFWIRIEKGPPSTVFMIWNICVIRLVFEGQKFRKPTVGQMIIKYVLRAFCNAPKKDYHACPPPKKKKNMRVHPDLNWNT